jgi:hypothetical protein
MAKGAELGARGSRPTAALFSSVVLFVLRPRNQRHFNPKTMTKDGRQPHVTFPDFSGKAAVNVPVPDNPDG